MSALVRIAIAIAISASGAGMAAERSDIPPDLREFYVYKGKCAELVIGDDDHSDTCGSAVFVSKFESGRSSILFQMIGAGIVTFYGAEQPADAGPRQFIIDHVAEDKGPAIAANGVCSLTSPVELELELELPRFGGQVSAWVSSDFRGCGRLRGCA